MNINSVLNAPGPAQQTVDAKLRRAAEDFEAILIGTWLKEVQESFASPTESAGADSYRSLGVEAVAGALAKTGGIGVARMILRQLRAPAAVAPAKDAAKDVP